MKHLLLLICLVLLSKTAYTTTFYISNSGNDTNNGGSPETAWATIDRLNEAFQNDEINDNDTILFRRGDIFYGAWNISMKGYFISAYGSGEKPKMSGARVVSGWEYQGDNVWRASFSSEFEPKFLFINGTSSPMGRYPDNDWLSYEQASGRTQITDNEFNMPDDYFNNGQCVIRAKRWVIDALNISSSSSSVINLSEEASYDLDEGSGYFILNHPNTLTFEGEWCYFDNHLYLYTAADPNALNITAPYHSEAAGLKYSYGEINGLAFEAYTAFGINASWECHDFTVRDCEFNYMGRDGIKLKYISPNLNVFNNVVRNSLIIGINVNYCDNVNIIGNVIENSGMVAGLGGNGVKTYEGVSIRGGTNITISENSIINSGYCAIKLVEAPNVQVINNYIDGACLVKDDGGGIYAWSESADPNLSGHTIEGNIITNVIGNTDGVHGESDLMAWAIYLDDNTMSVHVDGNTLFGNTKAFYIHNSQGNTFTNNILHNNRDAVTIFGNGPVDIVNNNITRNTFSSITDAGIYEVTPYSLRNYIIRLRANINLLETSMNNVFDYNTYCTPFYIDDYIGIDCPTDRAGRYNLEQFRQNTIQAKHSKSGPLQWDASMGISKEDFVVFDFALKNGKTLNIDGYYISSDSTIFYNQAVINPYSSLILFKENKQIATGLIIEGPQNICAANTLASYTFNNNNNFNNYSWELSPSEAGELIPVNDTTISIQFSTEYDGEAIVRVNACDTENNCNFTSAPISIKVNPTIIIEPDFTYSLSARTVIFTNTSGYSNVEWDFGDGQNSTEDAPEHTYEEDGSYVVELKVYSSECGIYTTSKTIVISTEPEIISGLIIEGPQNICAANTLASYTFNNNNNFNNYSWELSPLEAGELIPVNDTTISIQFSAEFDGEAIVRVNACDTENNCNFTSAPISITVNPTIIIEADFTYSISNRTVIFSNTSEYASVEWDFGDGQISTDNAPEYTYEEDGTYVVELRVYTSECGVYSISKTIEISNPTWINYLMPHSEEKINIYVFPNPANDMLKIILSSNIQGGIIGIYNLRGDLVFTQKINKNNEINISKLSVGTYIIRVESNKMVSSMKFIKTHF